MNNNEIKLLLGMRDRCRDLIKKIERDLKK